MSSPGCGTDLRCLPVEERTRAVRRRIVRGLAASATAPLATALYQVIAVPVFLGTWGVEVYGAWLTLTALPAALNFADAGLGPVAGSAMTMRVAAGQRDDAVEILQTAWVATTVLGAAAGTAVAVAAAFAPVEILTRDLLSGWEARVVILAAAGCALATLEGGVAAAGLRCDGHYATASALAAAGRGLELGCVVAALCWGGGVAVAAGVLLACRVATAAALWAVLRRRSPWLKFGVRRAKRDCLRRLAAPALTFLGFPAANVISGEGMVLAIGATLGPVAVVAFATMRTLTRFAFQLTDVVKNSVWPELSAAFGVDDIAMACAIHRRACQLSLGLAGAAVLLLAGAGKEILAAWTGGRVAFDPAVFRMLLAVLLVNAAWYTSSAALVACNRHGRVALLQALTASGAVLATMMAAPHYGLAAAAAALLASEAVMCGAVLPASLRLLGDSLRSFTGSLLRWRVVLLRP